MCHGFLLPLPPYLPLSLLPSRQKDFRMCFRVFRDFETRTCARCMDCTLSSVPRHSRLRLLEWQDRHACPAKGAYPEQLRLVLRGAKHRDMLSPPGCSGKI